MPAKGTFSPFCKRGHPRTPDSVVKGDCQECRKIRDSSPERLRKAREAVALYRKTHPESVKRAVDKRKPLAKAAHRRWQIIYQYGLTEERYNALLAEQSGCCKVCEVEFDSSVRVTSPHIDHDHSCCSGKKSCGNCVRGLLCGACNTGIGLLKDDPEVLQKAVAYLKGERC